MTSSAPGRHDLSCGYAEPRESGNAGRSRPLAAEIHGRDHLAYESLKQAQTDPDGAVVLSGDYGGTIFLTAPARLVQCDDQTLVTLVSDLDAVTWMSGDMTIATVAYERRPVGTTLVRQGLKRTDECRQVVWPRWLA